MVMPKYGASVDENQAEIVNALRLIGCQVESIGKPVDLLVGFRSLNFLLECKLPDTNYKGTQQQRDFIKYWPGQVRVVHTAEEAIELVQKSYGGR